MTEQSSEPREPVDSTQNSQSNGNNSKVDILKRWETWVSIFVSLAGCFGLAEITPKLVENIGSKPTKVKSQVETVEQTEPWSAVFKTRDTDSKESKGDETLQLNFQDKNVEGSSESTVNNENKEWTYVGHTDGNYLALSYKEKNTSALGTVLVRKHAEGKYIGYWEGKLCSDSNTIVRCPYVLVKGNSRANLSPKQKSHLTKSCIDTEFDGNSNQAFAGNPCL